MEAARTIRDSVQQVARLRELAAADPRLHAALLAVKRLQSRRFSGTYADLLQGGTFAAAAGFFLEELYGDRDYSDRDAQFARIAGAIDRFFPAQVARTAADLAALHALTEDLDLAMAREWLRIDGSDVHRYAAAWKAIDRAVDRERQLGSVVELGRELARLTRAPGLRTMLRMMRGAAGAAGLGELQRFLETGFDTFAAMARQRGAVEAFLSTVEEREGALLRALGSGDPVAAETELARILGQAP
ncbi:FFLEELY motif protein [Ramlibacter algicola]|uniref:DUF8198 domain-containing protein n=1 Tax=Ramlibacter algicola TaxID=2795217 RepID=A0A934UT68_9BURK|nr:hypothetical protein [Ramlibacter algicola]MBK0394990.1 hypothetical protein [Ramlibacter algicola]